MAFGQPRGQPRGQTLSWTASAQASSDALPRVVGAADHGDTTDHGDELRLAAGALAQGGLQLSAGNVQLGSWAERGGLEGTKGTQGTQAERAGERARERVYRACRGRTSTARGLACLAWGVAALASSSLSPSSLVATSSSLRARLWAGGGTQRTFGAFGQGGRRRGRWKEPEAREWGSNFSRLRRVRWWASHSQAARQPQTAKQPNAAQSSQGAASHGHVAGRGWPACRTAAGTVGPFCDLPRACASSKPL